MNCADFKEFLILMIFSFIVLCIFKIAFEIEFRKVKLNPAFDYPFFISIYQIYFVLCQQTLIFIFIKWYFAVVLCGVSFCVNKIIFTTKSKNSFFVQRFNKQKNSRRAFQHQKEIAGTDIMYSSGLGYYIETPLHEYKWWKAHLSSIVFILIVPVLKELSIINFVLPSNRIFQIVFDFFTFVGVLAGIYWIGYFGCSAKPLVEGWRRIYLWCYLGVAVFMILLFVCIESGFIWTVQHVT